MRESPDFLTLVPAAAASTAAIGTAASAAATPPATAMMSAIAAWASVSGVLAVEAGLFHISGFVSTLEGYDSAAFAFGSRFAAAHLGTLFLENRFAR